MEKKQKYQFFGRKKRRSFRDTERDIIERLMPIYELKIDEETKYSPSDFFDQSFESYELEIGFGKGEHVYARSELNKNTGFIAAEAYITGVVKLLLRLEPQGRENLKLYPRDVRYLLDVLTPDSLQRVYLLFPDPWPKNKHKDRRFISKESLDKIYSLLKTGGLFRVATDDVGYLEWVLMHLSNDTRWNWDVQSPADALNRPNDWIPTRYEEKALSQGKACYYLNFIKK